MQLDPKYKRQVAVRVFVYNIAIWIGIQIAAALIPTAIRLWVWNIAIVLCFALINSAICLSFLGEWHGEKGPKKQPVFWILMAVATVWILVSKFVLK